MRPWFQIRNLAGAWAVAGLSLFSAPSWSASDLPPAYAVSPHLVLAAEPYTEGVTFDAAGDLFFSQTKTGVVTRITPEGVVSVWATVPGCNGHKVLHDGTHVLAAAHRVVLMSPEGQIVKSIEAYEGTPLIYPNDITPDGTGGWYFTDSGTGDNKATDGALYYVDARGAITRLDTGMAFPNGLALSPDGGKLYVDEGNLDRNHVLVYDVKGPGKASGPKEFAKLPVKADGGSLAPRQIDNKPDGICVAAGGEVFVSHWGMGQIEVLDPKGRLLRSYPTGNMSQSNCAFGGPKHDQLFLTGSIELESGAGGLQRLDLGVKGVDLLKKHQ